MQEHKTPVVMDVTLACNSPIKQAVLPAVIHNLLVQSPKLHWPAVQMDYLLKRILILLLQKVMAQIC
jgi:hypothetical protein